MVRKREELWTVEIVEGCWQPYINGNFLFIRMLNELLRLASIGRQPTRSLGGPFTSNDLTVYFDGDYSVVEKAMNVRNFNIQNFEFGMDGIGAESKIGPKQFLDFKTELENNLWQMFPTPIRYG